MPAEIVFPGQPAIIGGGRVLPSPSAFYVTGEERLRIVSANSLAGVSLKLQWRLANPKGETVPNSVDHTPNTDRTVKRDDYELGTGSLLNVTVFANAGTPVIGQTYVMVQLVRGFGAAAIVLGTLLAGYVTATQAVGFPGSPIESSIAGGGYYRAFTGTAPAAGGELNETVPTGARWQIIALAVVFLASAVLGARRASFFFLRGFVQAQAVRANATTAAGGITAHELSLGVNPATIVIAGVQAVIDPMPGETYLRGGDTIQTSTAGLDAGDLYLAPILTVREWLEV